MDNPFYNQNLPPLNLDNLRSTYKTINELHNRNNYNSLIENKNNSPQSRYSQIAHYSQQNENPGVFLDLLQQVASRTNDLWRSTPLYVISKEYNLLLAAQGHLGHTGSFNFIHKNLFLDLIKYKEGDTYLTLKEGINSMHTIEANIMGAIPGFNRLRAKTLQNKFNELQPGQNFWIDLSSIPGEHAMKGRFICDPITEKITFQMANTGAGVNENPDLHKTALINGIEKKQTVIEWGPFEKSDLNPKFFRDILKSTIFGSLPKDYNKGLNNTDENQRGEFGELIKPVMAVYATIETYFKRDLLKDIPPHENSSYWNLIQEGPSCVPNSFWALAKVILTENEFKEISTDIRIQNLQRNYKKIASGYDRGAYTKIKVIEQIQMLRLGAQREGKELPIGIINIQYQLLEELPKGVRLKTKSPLIFNDQTVSIPIRQATLSKASRDFKAEVTFDSKDSDGDPIGILEIQRDTSHKPTGVNTLSYLLYESITNGDKKNSENYINEFIKYSNKFDGPNEIRLNANELKQIKTIIILFLKLSYNLRKVSKILEDRELSLALNHIIQTLYCIRFTNAEKNILRDNDEGLYEIISHNKFEAMQNYSIMMSSLPNTTSSLWSAQNKEFSNLEAKPAWEGVHQAMKVFFED